MIRILLILLICQLKKVGDQWYAKEEKKKNWQNSECARIFKTPNQKLNFISVLFEMAGRA